MNSPALLIAVVQQMVHYKRARWWQFRKRRKHLQSAIVFAELAGRVPMNQWYPTPPPTAMNPSDSECAGPR